MELMKYQKIRKFSYKTERKVPHNCNMDNWHTSPYTCFKTRFYIELSCFFVYLLQHTTIKPNYISYLYAIAGFAGGVCLASNNNDIIIAGIILLFSKVAIDGTDGLLARVKYKATNFGSSLDMWGGLVGEYSFIFGLGLYLFHFTENNIYIYIMVTISLLKSIDLKQFILVYVGASKYTETVLINEKLENIKKIKKIKNKSLTGRTRLLNFIINLVKGFNYNAKIVDLILLCIFFEIYNKEIIFTHYFLYLYLIRGIIIFLGNIYLTHKKNFVMNILKNKVKFK